MTDETKEIPIAELDRDNRINKLDKLPAVVTPMAMINKAISQNVSPETLGKLMDLQERWQKSEAQREFAEAMALAKGEIGPIIKNRTAGIESRRTGETHSYQYEDMAMIAEVLDPILAKYKLGYRHKSRQEGSKLIVTCILYHANGHTEDGATLAGENDTSGAKNPLQQLGSAVTYLERYTTKLSYGLAAAKDDDAQSTGNGRGAETAKPITKEQFQELRELLDDCNESEDRLLSVIGVKDPNRTMHDLNVREYQKAKTLMVNAIQKRERNRRQAKADLGEEDDPRGADY